MSCSVCAGYSISHCPVCGERYEVIKCPQCGGYGLINCEAVEVGTNEPFFVNTSAYMTLPEDEYEALCYGKKYYKSDAETCPLCNGLGEVYKDSHGKLHTM